MSFYGGYPYYAQPVQQPATTVVGSQAPAQAAPAPSYYGGFQGFPAQGFPAQGFPAQGFPMQGYPQAYPAASAAPAVVSSGAPAQAAPAPIYGGFQGFPSQGYPAQGFPVQGYSGQGYPGQGFPQAYPAMSAAPAVVTSGAPAQAAPAPFQYGAQQPSYYPYPGSYAGGGFGSGYGARSFDASPYGQRSIYRPRRNERYGEILYSAPIWDDRDGQPENVEVRSDRAAQIQGNAWNVDIEVVAARGLPTTMGGTFRKDKLDPYVIVKVGSQTGNTKEKKDAGSEALFGDKLHFSGSGARPTSGTLSVYDCDGDLKPGAAVPGKSDDLIGSANFNLIQGDQNITIQDPKKGSPNGTVTIRVL